MSRYFSLETFKSLFSKYVLFNDRTQEENEKFREYVHDLISSITISSLLASWALLIITWPTDYIFYEKNSIQEAYFYWRITGLLIALIISLAWYLLDTIRQNAILLTSLGATGFTFFTGYIFGTVTSFQEPWFSVIYLLPVMSVALPLGILPRIILTHAFPVAYFLGFLVTRPLSEYVYPGMQTVTIGSSCWLSIILGHGIYIIVRKNYFQSKELEKERERSDELLHNTLPKPIVDRLKRGEDVSDRFDEVTVLFADLVEFTPLADELPPEEVVDLLDGVFSTFDDLTEEYGVEKIKTIGDEYFVASGVPEPANDHALRCAKYALRMQDIVKEHTRDDDHPFELRIGMNTGSLVAGVIGNKRFAYDVWGDIVNVGSRMESQGEPGKIQVTPATKEAIEEQDEEERFSFSERGQLDVKGKGTMTTYFLEN